MDLVENFNAVYEYMIFIIVFVLHILFCYDLFHSKLYLA